MRRPQTLVAAAAAALLTLGAAGCGGDSSSSPAHPGSSGAAGTPSHRPTHSPPTTTPPASPATTGGTADDPAVLTPTRRLLDWHRVAGSIHDSVTRSGPWTLTVNESGSEYSLDGPRATGGSDTGGRRVSDALIDGHWAVVVLQDRTEQRPSRAEVTDLATGDRFTLDGDSDVPTTNGGTWALGEGHLLHATVAHGSYCLATVDLRSRTSQVGWCAPKRHGFSDARITPAGESVMAFDDSHPSCRTVAAVEGDRLTPFPGVPDCHGHDGLLIDDGAVWSVVTNEHRIEQSHFYARTGDQYFDLGPGLSGSLVWCGGAAYFDRDPQRDGEPARLMRWSPRDGLSIAYESPGGQAFLSAPRCGGDALTVTALAQRGDEQVTAPTD